MWTTTELSTDRILRPVYEIRFFLLVKLQFKTSAAILSLGIKYSTRDQSVASIAAVDSRSCDIGQISGNYVSDASDASCISSPTPRKISQVHPFDANPYKII